MMNRVDEIIFPLPMKGEGVASGMRVVECSNLRRSKDGRNLEAVGSVKKNEKLSGLPSVVIRDSAGDRIGIVKTGNRLRAVKLTGEESGHDVGGVAGSVLEVVMTGEDKGIVMTDAGRYNLMKREGKWVVEEEGAYPVLHFEAGDVMQLSVVAETRELKGIYDTRSRRLVDSDAERLRQDLLRSYKELVDKANRGGMELQPVLARYRLEGDAGEVLYRSPIVQVGASSGVQCVEELRCDLVDNNSRRGELRLSAEVYKLRLCGRSASEVSAGKVKRLVVETSLPVHPVVGNVVAANMLEQSGTNGVALRCFLPGASVTMVSSREDVARRLSRLALKGDIAFRESLVVNNPFASGSEISLNVNVARSGVNGVDAEIAAVEEMLRRSVKVEPEMACKCMLPNRFVAESGCVVGEYIVWGGVRVKGFQGYGIDSFSTTVSESGEIHSWRSVVETELSTGKRRVATSWGTENAPLKLSPILSYPRVDAVKMRITLERDGIVYRGEFSLQPNESRTGAYYFNEDGREIDLSAVEDNFSYAIDEKENEQYASLVVVSSVGNPMESRVGEKVGTGRVVKVLGVDRRGSAWEFGRHRVYVMTEGGIYLMSVASEGKSLMCNRIDRRGVMSKGGVAETDDDRYPVVCVASGDLIGLSRGNVSTLEEGISEDKLGWDICNKELWIAEASGLTRVKGGLDGGWRQVDGMTVAGFQDSGEGLLIESDMGIRDTALGEESMSTIGYRLKFEISGLDRLRYGHKLQQVGVDMRGAKVVGTLSVAVGTSGIENSGYAGEMSIVGDVDMPLVMQMGGCRGSEVEVVLRGEMQAGSELREMFVIKS